MFVEEMELEKRHGGFVLLIVLTALILAVAGVAVYQLRESRNVLTTSEGASIASSVLQGKAQATVRFHIGKLVSSVADSASDPHYRLLEKAGVLKFHKGKSYDSPATVTLTPKGEELLKQIPGVKKSQEKDGTEAYMVPLASRKLVEVSKVSMTGNRQATLEFLWRWVPNALGESFDVDGALVKTFNTWDRATLINKYGADFYHAAPTKVTVAVVRTDKGWQLPSE